jgi:hypothetical protein
VENDTVTDQDIEALAREATEGADERLRRVCMAALHPSWAKKYNIRADFAREQCERFIRESRAGDKARDAKARSGGEAREDGAV